MKDRRRGERRGTRMSRLMHALKVRVLLAIALSVAFVGGCELGASGFRLDGDSVESSVILYDGTPVVLGASEYRDLFPLWMREANRRFKNPVVVFCHGGTSTDSYGNQFWVAFHDDGDVRPVAMVALEMKARYPDRPVVLVICNPDGLPLGVSGVTYSRSGSVWVQPDRDLSVRSILDPSAIGNIHDMITDE